MSVNILLIGDIVGKPGRTILKNQLPGLIEKHSLDLVIANGENAAQGSGITPKLYEEIRAAGVDVVTLGDHTWKRKEVLGLLDKADALLRPENYPKECPGRGFGVFSTRGGVRVGLVTLLGRIFMPPTDCPFRAVEDILERHGDEASIWIVEIHAEATSEKMAIAWLLSGKVSCVFGTHTHVPTADARLLRGGTAYLTDLGMTGPYDSVIGRDADSVLFKFRTQMHAPFNVPTGDVRLCGALISADESTGKALSIERVEVLDDFQDASGNARDENG